MKVTGYAHIQGRGTVYLIDVLSADVENGMVVYTPDGRAWTVNGIETHAMPRSHTNGKPAGLILRGEMPLPAVGETLHVRKKTALERTIEGWGTNPDPGCVKAAPWRFGDACICGAVEFSVRTWLSTPVDGPELEARMTPMRLAVGLKPFETCNGSYWQVCERPECLELAKKYDNENRQL